MKLFLDDQPFLKGNFHTHTTCSDGRKTPAEAMALYRAEGYDVLAITDHRKVIVPEKSEVPEGLLVLTGIELDYMLPGQAVHIVGIGVDEGVVDRWDPNGPPQQGVDAIRAGGGEAILAHPAWSMNTPQFMASLTGLVGTEIWNSVSTLPYNGDRADSSSLLDVMCASTSQVLPVFANDDAHFYGSDFASGATMVQATERTVPAVMQALREGRFYATRGPRIHQIEITDDLVRVDCSEAEAVVFYSARPWSSDRNVLGHGLTHAEYPLSPADGFIRVQVIDAQGKSAWSAPVKV